MPTDPNCIFCKIVKGEIPSQRVYEDDEIIAFHDLHPIAPVHILVIPREHFPTVADVPKEKTLLLGRLIQTANQIAREQELDLGYRLVINCRPDAGQEVFHVHLHLLGGRKFGWPPG
jgi:histidine triad (HIT) family protein